MEPGRGQNGVQNRIQVEKGENTKIDDPLTRKPYFLSSRASKIGPKTGSKLVPNRIFDAEALRTPLESLLERSWKRQEPKKRSWERLWSGLGPKRGAKMGAEIGPQNAPRCLQEARTAQEGSKKPLGANFKPPGSPQTLKNSSFAQ